MKIIKKPEKLNTADFKSGINNPKVYYGLPTEVKYCKECTYSNQKPNSEIESQHRTDSKKPILTLGENGICQACEISKRKRNIDWKLREKELLELCKKHKKNDGSYDCIVPGSGGKDSFYASHILKYKYGMNPLTVTWAPHIYTSWGYKNFKSWLATGFDNYLFTPNSKIHRLLTRLSLEKLFHPFQPFILGQMHFPPKRAAQLNIPLVFYGENPVEYGNNKEKYDSPLKDKKYFVSSSEKKMFFSGFSEEELVEFGISKEDLSPYKPPSEDQIKSKNVQTHYLGYYLPWHPQNNYYYTIQNSNFESAPERSPGTYDKYSSIDDKIDDLYWYTLYIKFGLGRATYSSSQEIRNGEIDRKEGIRLVEQFDGEYPTRFEKENFAYLTIDKKNFPIASEKFEEPIMTREYFNNLSNKFRSPHLWCFDQDNKKWFLRTKLSAA